MGIIINIEGTVSKRIDFNLDFALSILIHERCMSDFIRQKNNSIILLSSNTSNNSKKGRVRSMADNKKTDQSLLWLISLFLVLLSLLLALYHSV